jgi:organic radical activating enzyme
MTCVCFLPLGLASGTVGGHMNRIHRLEGLVYFARKTLRSAVRWYLQSRAFLTGKRFCCSALAGKSSYNIGINSDLSVSCNCRDWDGAGRLGSLRENTLEEVFASTAAKAFRRKLAAGRLPILACAPCPELRLVSPEEARQEEVNYHVPSRGIMVENTSLCNYRCVSCSREKLVAARKAASWSTEDLKTVAATIKKHRIETVAFFNLGEPFAHKHVFHQIQAIRAENPSVKISSSTNGILLNTDEKREAALMLVWICFSIDGPDTRTMNKYQRGAKFEAAYENMKRLVEYRDKRSARAPLIEWKYVLFNWNDRKEMIERAVSLARGANVDVISFWPTRAPIYGISWRYYLSPFFRKIGQPCWKGREIVLRETAETVKA